MPVRSPTAPPARERQQRTQGLTLSARSRLLPSSSHGVSEGWSKRCPSHLGAAAPPHRGNGANHPNTGRRLERLPHRARGCRLAGPGEARDTGRVTCWPTRRSLGSDNLDLGMIHKATRDLADSVLPGYHPAGQGCDVSGGLKRYPIRASVWNQRGWDGSGSSLRRICAM